MSQTPPIGGKSSDSRPPLQETGSLKTDEKKHVVVHLPAGADIPVANRVIRQQHEGVVAATGVRGYAWKFLKTGRIGSVFALLYSLVTGQSRKICGEGREPHPDDLNAEWVVLQRQRPDAGQLRPFLARAERFCRESGPHQTGFLNIRNEVQKALWRFTLESDKAEKIGALNRGSVGPLFEFADYYEDVMGSKIQLPGADVYFERLVKGAEARIKNSEDHVAIQKFVEVKALQWAWQDRSWGRQNVPFGTYISSKEKEIAQEIRLSTPDRQFSEDDLQKGIHNAALHA